MNTIAAPFASVPSSSYHVVDYQNHLINEASGLMNSPSFGESQVVGSKSIDQMSTIESTATAAACNTRFVSPRHESEDDVETCEDFYKALKQAYAEDARRAAEIAYEFVHDISDDEVSAVSMMEDDDDEMIDTVIPSTTFYFSNLPSYSSHCMLYDTCYPSSAFVTDAGESIGEAAFNANRCVSPASHEVH